MDLFDHFETDAEVERFEKLKAAKDIQAEDYEPAKAKRLDVFKDILPSILKTKKNILENEKDYDPYITNLALSQYGDAIFYVNEMNMMWQLPNRMQYDYYFQKLRSMNRGWPKWGKVAKQEDMEIVKKYFGYSNNKAAQALRILTEENLDHIRKVMTIGE